MVVVVMVIVKARCNEAKLRGSNNLLCCFFDLETYSCSTLHTVNR